MELWIQSWNKRVAVVNSQSTVYSERADGASQARGSSASLDTIESRFRAESATTDSRELRGIERKALRL